MGEKEKINLSDYPSDLRELDPSFDPKLTRAFEIGDKLEGWEGVVVDPELDRQISRNFRTQVKIKKSILGKIFPSLIKNRKFIERVGKAIAITNCWKDFLCQCIPGKN